MSREKHSGTPEQRFAARTPKGLGPDECWEYIGTLKDNGYGNFWDGERVVGAHRYALQLHLGRPVRGLVLHSCDNRPCINPSHLREGTAAENMHDMDARGRRVARTKLSDDDIETIISLRGVATSKELGERFGVHWVTISRVWNNRQRVERGKS